MKIPRKIDDRLKNSIVQIHFESNLPSGAIFGYFHGIFNEEVQFMPSKTPIISNGKIIGIEETTPIIVTNDKNFTILIQDNTITFDLVDGYKGWEIYIENIKKYITPIFESNIINKVNQLGVRYISNFDEVMIYEHINANINLEFVKTEIKGQSRFEFSINNNIVILNLISGSILVNPNNESPKLGSIIDIDVIQKPNLSSIEELVKTVNEIHEVEKSIFFSLLKGSFLSTLNPIY
jgi:uncharacterized protein (TIGR04255 family)